ncbi:MAG: CDP-alcohol phosphatidyltransferase family protein [Candidatus Binatia bacterium]
MRTSVFFSVLTLPNVVTLLRIGAIPVFLILLTDNQYTAALVVFLLAGATDSLDGALARLTNSHTALGAYIDPLADKLLLVSSFVILAFLGFIPRWLAILVISRDVIILLGFVVLFFVTGHSIAVRPSFIGKASTFFQLLTVTLTLASLHNPAWHFPFLWYSVLALTGGTTVISGVQYLSRALLWFNEHDEEPPISVRNGNHSQGGKDTRHYSA